MKIILPGLLLLAAACASIPDTQRDETVLPPPPPVVEKPAVKPIAKKIIRIQKRATEPIEETGMLPCPVDTDDPKQEILKKLDCLLEDK